MNPDEAYTTDLVGPVFFQEKISAPVELANAAAELKLLGPVSIINGHCTLTAHWDGRGLIGKFEGDVPPSFSGHPEALQPISVGIAVDGLSASDLPVDLIGKTSFQPTLFDYDRLEFVFKFQTESIELLSGRHNTKSVIAHLLNVPYYLGTKISAQLASSSGYRWARSRLQFNAEQWKVTIDGISCWLSQELDVDSRKNLLTLQSLSEVGATGGLLITHALRLEMLRGTTFNRAQALGALGRLETILTFAFGGAGQPIEIYGFDPNEQTIWASLQVNPNLPLSGGLRKTYGWLPNPSVRSSNDEDVARVLNESLSAMAGYWSIQSKSDSMFAETVGRAVNWYAASLRSFGGNECVVLAQASLEILSAFYLTQTLRLSDDGQKDLKFADQLTVVLSSMKISVDLPGELSSLHLKPGGTTKAVSSVTGPSVITATRNSLVHPRSGREKPTGLQMLESQTLALWYVEMILFKLLNYRGYYWDRVKRDLQESI
jgi:hypothetical protein